MSSEGWELSPPTREGSRFVNVYSTFQSITALPPRSEGKVAGGDAAARTAAMQSHNGGYFVDLVNPDSLRIVPPAIKAAPTAAAANAQGSPMEVNAHSYSLFAPHCEGTTQSSSPPHPLQRQKTACTNAPLTADGDVDAIHITSPNSNSATVQGRRLSIWNEASSPISGGGGRGGGRKLSTGPAAALMNGRALPLPPASSPASLTHAAGVENGALAVSGIVQGVCTVPLPAAAVADTTSGTRPRTGSKKKSGAKRKKRKLTPPPLPASQDDLPNLRSVLGPSATPPCLASPHEQLSASPSVLPSFRVDAPTPPAVEGAKNPRKVNSGATKTAAVAATTAAIETTAKSLATEREGASPVRSVLGSTPDHNSSTVRNHRLDYGSFLLDYVVALPTRRASTPPAATNPPTSTVAVQADNTGSDSNSKVNHQRKEDGAVSDTEQDVGRVFTPLRNNARRLTQDVMDTSLFAASPRDSLQHSSLDDEDYDDTSSMDSLVEMCLPHARNLRPQQWQYASVLQRKIGEKVKARQADIVVERKKPNPKTGSQLQRQTSAGMTPAKVRRASTGAEKDGKGQQLQQHLTQFPLQPTTCHKAPDEPPAMLERSEEDVGSVSCNGFDFSNFLPPDAVKVSAAAVPLSPVKPKRRPSAVLVHRGAVQYHEAAEEGVAVRATDSPATPSKRRSRDSAAASEGRLSQRVADNATSASSRAADDDEGTVQRVSSLLSLGASVFTDNGYPIIATHLSDFYRESLTSLSAMSATSLSTTSTAMEDTRDKVEASPSGVVMVDGRLLLQGMGYPTTAIKNSSFKSAPITFAMQQHLPYRGSNPPSPTKGGRVGAVHPEIGENMTAMSPVKGCRPPLPPRRWSTTGASIAAVVLPPPTAASRQQLLRNQQRRLLREQRLHVRQLRNTATAGMQPQTDTRFCVSPPAAFSVEVPTRCQQVPEKPQQQQQPLALPIAPTRKMLATAFFAAESSSLHLQHRGTTAKATPQPDIQYGPFVATDKSRFIDFEKALGFNLKDVPTITSPRWDSLSVPQPTVDSEEL